MKLLIVAATHAEINETLKLFSLTKKVNNRFSFYQYKSSEIDVLITGVGMLFTAYHLTKIISQNKYDLAINIGLAGTFKNDLPIGEVVNVTQDILSELGAENDNEWLSISDLNLLSEDDFPYTDKGVKNDFTLHNESINKLQKVKGITVNTVHGNEKSIETIQKRFNPDVETMEGTAFLYCCISEKISCIQIRAISNLVEKRNRANWNIPLALKNLNTTLIEILDTLN